jgi:hypothetical protein
MTSLSETRVEKIYDEYDKDKDGYLTEDDFLNFYETSARSKESAVWSNLETFGVRNDLEILDSVEITYPQKDTLTRYLLYNNPKFMSILFHLLGSNSKPLAETAWNLVARLPIYLNFTEEVDF